MLNIRTEADKWSMEVNSLWAKSIEKLLEVGRHWMQIKALERLEQDTLSRTPPDLDFRAKMQWVDDFLFDLSKNIWQNQ